MNCPKCPDTALLMTERQGIEIDYCPQCRGVWLDRGELDKLVSLASTAEQDRAPVQPPQPYRPYPAQESFRDSRPHSHQHHDSAGYGRRKKSWISELFD